jgi:hypothetical protein
VSWSQRRYKAVDFQGFAGRKKILPCDFNNLKNSPNFRRIRETGRKQGKFTLRRSLPTTLSTGTVDTFTLAYACGTLQRSGGIDEPQKRSCA